MEMIPKKYQKFSEMVSGVGPDDVVKQGERHLIDTISKNIFLSDLRTRFNAIGSEVTTAEFEKSFLPEISNRGWVDALISKLLDIKRITPLYFPGLKAIELDYFNAVEIFSHPKASIVLSVVDHTKIGEAFSDYDHINVMSFTTYLYFIKATAAKIYLYESDPGRTCSKAVIDAQTGMVVKVEGGRNSMKFMSAEEDLVVLGVNFFENNVKECSRISVKDASVVSKSSSDLAWQRIFMYSSLLRLMDRTDAISSLGMHLKHEDPSLRWHVMREILAMDSNLAAPLLENLAQNDPCPDVKRLASNAIEKFYLNEQS